MKRRNANLIILASSAVRTYCHVVWVGRPLLALGATDEWVLASGVFVFPLPSPPLPRPVPSLLPPVEAGVRDERRSYCLRSQNMFPRHFVV